MNISIFPISELNDKINESLAEKYKEATISYKSSVTQMDFLFAVHRDDVVIVDCTVDDETGGVYPILTSQINCFNHIIVVSKNNLPLNITPYRGVFPKGMGPVLSDDEILKELPDVIEKSLKEDRYDRVILNDIDDLGVKRNEMENMILASLDARVEKSSEKTKVMISYRNSHSHEVEAFKEIIEGSDEKSKSIREKMGCHGDYTVKVLPPASLCGSYEALTPMRRWMLVGLLDDEIRDVDEVWVYESYDNDGRANYLDSWWTIAELVMVAYINYNNSKKIKVKVYNAFLQTFYYVNPQRYIVDLEEPQKRRLARLLANTRPDTMGPEANKNIRKLKIMAFIMRLVGEEKRKMIVDNLRPFIEQFVPTDLDDDDRKEMIEELIKMYSSPDELSRYANDDVHKKDFWEKLSYQTTDTTSCFVNGKIYVDKFLSAPMEELVGCTKKYFERAVKRKGKINLGSFFNPKIYYVKKADFDRYLWLATRMGNPTVKDAPGLERIKIYNLYQIPKK